MDKVLLTEYFTIVSSIQDDKINFDKSSIDLASSVPFLGRSAGNNGIVGYVSKRQDKLNKGGILTVALDGSTGSTFYQHHDFCSGQNIWALVPNEKHFPEGLTPLIALFFVTTIRKAVINYSYNLSLTKTRLSKVEILVPLTASKEIDTDYIYNKMQGLRNVELLTALPQHRIVEQ